MNDAPTRAKKVIWPHLITVLSAAVLMGTVVIGMALSTAWAIAGLFGLGEIFAWVLEAVFGIAGLAVIVAFIRNASRIEPFFER